MKSRLNLILAAFLAIIGVLLWTIVKDHGRAAPLAAVVAPVNTASTLTIRVQTAPPTTVPAVIAAAPVAPQPVAVSTPVPIIAPADGTIRNAKPPAGEVSNDGSKYTAQDGDTVSNLAAALPGGDKKVNRDAVIDANPSLQRDPDLVLAGKTYQIPTTNPAPTDAVTPTPAPVVAQAPAVDAAPEEPVHELRYIARAGDNVSTLAAALLGRDTKENRDAIIAANPSLQGDPDRVIAGQRYRIPVSQSQPLAAAPADATAAAARPAAQPDADKVVLAGSPRVLRYTAQPGDNVSTLSTALLGSDTKENRDAIINNNESLKQDPDRVVAGKSYWIPAPMPAQP